MITFGVIVRVPPDEDHGNLALAAPVFLQTGNDPSEVVPVATVLSAAAIMLRAPVFHVGEILVLDGEQGREVAGLGRKPSKWDVGVEHMTDLGAAVARAREVTGN